MVTKKQQNEQGAASLIVVLFISVIFTIITIGFLRASLNEQRIATDDDLTSRAFYAAESGVEDARRAIEQYLGGRLVLADLNGDSCDVPNGGGFTNILSPPNEFDVEYNCMRIDFTPTSIRSELNSANQIRQYAIIPTGDPNTNIGSITLRWHIDAPIGSDGDGDVPGTVNLRGGQTSIPRIPSWNFPAMMQVNFISYPDNNAQRGDILSSSSWISPGNGSGVAPATVFNGSNKNAAVDGEVLVASCSDNQNDYSCSMTFNMGLAGNRNLEMRLTNLYESTSFEVTMENTAGRPLLFDEVQAVVDVTGRAGPVSRRVEAILDLATPSLLPDFTVQSASDICKDFTFTDDLDQFGGNAGESCTF